MRAEIRADGLHISGYVNVPGRQSRPLVTPRGRVNEVIEQGAFARAIQRAGEIRMLLDHDEKRVLATTGDGSLAVKEDAVGLHAESVVTDPEVIDGARSGRLRGWSFDMRKVVDEVETRADGLPIRHVKDFDMSEITLVMNKIPAYSSTSIEVRADTEQDDDATVEIRAEDLDAEVVDLTSPKDPEEPEDPENLEDPEDPEDQEDPEDDQDPDDTAERLRTYEARVRSGAPDRSGCSWTMTSAGRLRRPATAASRHARTRSGCMPSPWSRIRRSSRAPGPGSCAAGLLT